VALGTRDASQNLVTIWQCAVSPNGELVFARRRYTWLAPNQRNNQYRQRGFRRLGNSPPISREDMAISKKHLMAAAGFA
jgi:hypothetical protein